jgi:hypothetical protein
MTKHVHKLVFAKYEHAWADPHTFDSYPARSIWVCVCGHRIVNEHK